MKPGILVTRATLQANKTIAAITEQNWKPILFPTVEIHASNQQENNALFSQLDSYDWLIFISQNAVNHFIKQISHLPSNMPSIATIGLATSEAAHQAGLEVLQQPEHRFDSEGLLATEAFSNLSNKKILIIRGNGGRELLAETLRERGAQVTYAQVYERRLPKVNTKPLIQQWNAEVDIILSTSNQLLDNLVTLVGKEIGQKLFSTPIVVVSKRMQQHALNLGFDKIWLAEGASDDQMIITIKKHLAIN